MKRWKTICTLDEIHGKVVTCRLCPRLVEYREGVAAEKKSAFKDWQYWGKPVPGFGDPNAQLVIVGLAPAAHGGNRTGRVFTGDPTSQFLMHHLHMAGFANKPTSEHIHDGLKLKGAYMTAAVKCAPPNNRPNSREIANCTPYLAKELKTIKSARVVLVLGRIAFDATLQALHSPHLTRKSRPVFGHGEHYNLGAGLPTLFASYHPSPRNTQTGKLTSSMFMKTLRDVRRYLGRRRFGDDKIRSKPTTARAYRDNCQRVRCGMPVRKPQ